MVTNLELKEPAKLEPLCFQDPFAPEPAATPDEWTVAKTSELFKSSQVSVRTVGALERLLDLSA